MLAVHFVSHTDPLVMCRIHTAIFGTIAAGLLVAPAGTLADVTIGSDLSGTPGQAVCEAGTACTYVQTSDAVAPVAVSPIDGRIVRWRLKAGAAAGPVALRVLRSSPPEYTAVATSASVKVAPGVNTFTTNLPVRAAAVAQVTTVEESNARASSAAVWDCGSRELIHATRSAGWSPAN